MKKLLLLFLLFLAFRTSAQTDRVNTANASAGVEVGIPGNGVYTIGIGVSVKGEVPIANKFSLTGTAGFSTFFYKSNLFDSSRDLSSAGFTPLKGGAKYYINEGFYVEGEAGIVIETNYLKQNLVAFSLGPGFVLPTNNGHGIDFGIRYESWSHSQLHQTAIRFAYRFGK